MDIYISSPARAAQILNQYGIKLKKSFGQNFLIDTNIARKIVLYSDIKPQDVVLEVGSGIGSLTKIMLPCVKKVICVEIDKFLSVAFKDIFECEIGRKIELIEKDALRLDYGEISKKYRINKMVSNLPYKIAAPLILKILLEEESIESFCVTIQKDIADRLISQTGSKNYSSYAVKANFLASFKICFPISRSCFMPKPLVDSAVVRVERKDIKNIFKDFFCADTSSSGTKDAITDFFGFIDGCFLHRRKKLVNSLEKSSSKYSSKADLVVRLLSEIGKDKNARAEELNLEDFIFLYKNMRY